jgi:hypothetical protein
MEMVPDSKMEIASDSEEVATDDVAPDSEEVAADSVDLLLSMEGLDSVDPLQSIEALDSIIVQDSIEMVPDSMESAMLSSEMEEVADSMAADSEVVAPESEEVVAPVSKEIIAPESEEIVAPDSLPSGAFICHHCQVVHLNREAWDRVHTSSVVILSFRGMFRNAFKSKGIALRPTLPFFRLETTTGTELESCVLPRFQTR